MILKIERYSRDLTENDFYHEVSPFAVPDNYVFCKESLVGGYYINSDVIDVCTTDNDEDLSYYGFINIGKTEQGIRWIRKIFYKKEK